MDAAFCDFCILFSVGSCLCILMPKKSNKELSAFLRINLLVSHTFFWCFTLLTLSTALKCPTLFLSFICFSILTIQLSKITRVHFTPYSDHFMQVPFRAAGWSQTQKRKEVSYQIGAGYTVAAAVADMRRSQKFNFFLDKKVKIWRCFLLCHNWLTDWHWSKLPTYRCHLLCWRT